MSRLDEIKARCDAATEGPWSAKGGFTSDPMIEVYGQTVFINPDLDGDPIQPEVWADVEFIAAAREDVPWLVDQVESLERWKFEACEVMSGLRELGKALGLGLGVQITGPAALAEVARLTAERDALAQIKRHIDEVRNGTGWTVQIYGVLLQQCDQYGKTIDTRRAERAEAERDALAAQVARVEEVLDHWRTVDEGNAAYAERIGERSRFADGLASRADMLRAALAGSIGQESAPDAGHKCEPYYSRSECGQCGWQEQWCVTCSRQMCGCATETTNQEDQA